MEISDKLVLNIKMAAIALLVLSIMIGLYQAYYLILAMIEHKRLTYQYFLLTGYFALLCTLISRLFYTLYLDKVSGWFNRVGDFISISCGLLCEIEILRLLVVLVPFLNNRRVFIMEIIAFVFCMITGGFNFFWGFGYLTSKDDNFFGKVLIKVCNTV
ncbi:hypothetical protein BC833DRAFT_662649 [Globomyces pollinis-pini]|nr:hypothetical protein BC833DRAFT_662649 [Globomyces pollinis-pini]